MNLYLFNYLLRSSVRSHLENEHQKAETLQAVSHCPKERSHKLCSATFKPPPQFITLDNAIITEDLIYNLRIKAPPPPFFIISFDYKK